MLGIIEHESQLDFVVRAIHFAAGRNQSRRDRATVHTEKVGVTLSIRPEFR